MHLQQYSSSAFGTRWLVFVLKENFNPRLAFNLKQIIHVTLIMASVCCSETSSTALLTSVLSKVSSQWQNIMAIIPQTPTTHKHMLSFSFLALTQTYIYVHGSEAKGRFDLNFIFLQTPNSNKSSS